MADDARDEDEMICALTSDEHELLQRRLRGLPETMPPRAVWHRIREQAEAEGLIGRPASRRPSTWYVGGAIAATVLVAVLVARQPEVLPQQEFPTTPPPETSNTATPTALQALMVESRQLETDLRQAPAEPRVVRAGTAAMIAELEDRIAAIDYQLSDPEIELSPEDEEIFWRERVRLMKSLVRLRYAQAHRAAF